MNSTISEQHRNKTAYVYVRQSTLAQVRHHQESTERQYALREKALELGWGEPTVQILDRDLGKSGAQIAGREDFKTLVAEVSMGQVGAVFALEVSRLARSNLDWHRLLELCALTDTLVIDEDGCYNPADFNDGLLLGLKGTMAQAELHWLRGRLLGGKLNKAKKGELRFPLPVGLCFAEESAGCRGIGVSSFSRDRDCLRRNATIRGKYLAIPQAILRWSMEWEAGMGSTHTQSRAEHDQEPVLCGDVRLWPLSISKPDQSFGGGAQAGTTGCHGGLAR
jgi:DNA invertase Pin-like site-specific DNA recombinase